MRNDLGGNLTLLCPACGDGRCAFDHNAASIHCPSCGREFSRDELVRGDSHISRQAVRGAGRGAVNGAVNELRASVGRSFHRSKYIRYR
jgi:ribosomal protein S27E